MPDRVPGAKRPAFWFGVFCSETIVTGAVWPVLSTMLFTGEVVPCSGEKTSPEGATTCTEYC